MYFKKDWKFTKNFCYFVKFIPLFSVNHKNLISWELIKIKSQDETIKDYQIDYQQG